MGKPIYHPTLEEFREQAKQHNLIAVYREILADLESPVSALLKIDDGDNAIYGVRIQGNIMTGAAIGIDWDDTAAYNCFVTDNYVRAVGLTIDEEGDNIFVINNRLITDVNTGTSTAGYDFNIQLSAGNIQMGATGLGDTIPFAKIAE